MDNWLVTAVAAATTALGAFVATLAGHAPAETLPHAVGTASHHLVGAARPGPAAAPSVAATRARPAVAERPSRDDAARARRAAHHRAQRRHHGHQSRTQHRHRGRHHPHRHATRHHAGGSAQHAVRRAPIDTRPVLSQGVPARRVIGIRHALGMHPAMGPLGTDVSWPQCGGHLPMPLVAARFVVVGLTDGPAFSANHCLHRQAAWVRAHERRVATYAVVSYPNRHELARLGGRGPYQRHRLTGRLRNVGYQQALMNLRRMHGAGLHSPIVWIDLEPSSSHPWPRRTGLNAAVVRGLVHGYRSHGQRIGFYSTALIWHHIVGHLRFRAPEWRTAGPASPHAALSRCHERDATIQGGPAVLAQWWNDRRDHDLVCPGQRSPAGMTRWFEHS